MSTREKVQAKGNGQQALGERSNKIFSYKDLLVWQKSMQLVETVYRLSVQLPASEPWGSDLANAPRGRFTSVKYRRRLRPASHWRIPSSPFNWPRFLIKLETQVLLSLRVGSLEQGHGHIILPDIEE